MNKRQLISSLCQMEKMFADDSVAVTAIAVLKQKAEILMDDEEKTRGPSNFPIPNELQKYPNGLALFSDGACRGNPGPGAWAAIGQDATGEIFFESTGMEFATTNNVMELSGALFGLENVRNHLEAAGISNLTPIFLYSDSKYLIDGMNSWVDSWKKRGWKKADNKAPENLKIWQDLDLIRQQLNICFIWIKGHAGHPQNEYCDKLANQTLDQNGG